MSAVKSKGSAKDLKSYFAPKSESSSATKENHQCIDLTGDQNSQRSKSNDKPLVNKNLFFMSQAEKKEKLAQEREARIQEEINRSRQETNKLLVNKQHPASALSDFFTAKPAALKPTDLCDKVTVDDAKIINGDEMVALPLEHAVGLQDALHGLYHHREQLPARIQRVPRIDLSNSAAFDPRPLCLPTGAVEPLADWAALNFTGISRAGQGWMYPEAQTTLHLRAAWAKWTLTSRGAETNSTNQVGDASPSSGGGGGVCALGAAQAAVRRWLEQWAEKRRASLSRSSTQQSRGSRSRASSRSSSRCSAGRGSSSSNRGRAGRKRRLAADSSDEGDADSSDSDAEGEWSAAEDSAQDELEDSSCEEGGRGRDRRASAGTAAPSAGREDGAEESLTNVLVLEGPSGSGKSAAVHQCAAQLGYRVIEVNAAQTRSGAAVRKTIAEATQSAHILDAGSGGSAGAGAGTGGTGGVGTAGAEMSLILFDEVDIVFEEEGDTQLYSAIQSIAHTSKCPIVLTTERPLPFFQALQAKHVKFRRCAYQDSQEAQSVVAALEQELTRVTSSSIPAPTAATAAFFAPRKQVGPVQGSVETVTTPFSATAKAQLTALTSISGGDLRAAIASAALAVAVGSAGKHMRPAGTTIDLTESPCKKNSSATSNAPPPTEVSTAAFSVFLRDELMLDFALFDHRPKSSSVAVDELLSRTPAPINSLRVPVVHGLCPRSGLCSGGFTVTIEGSNFLQAGCWGVPESENLDQQTPAEVRVMMDDGTLCPCALKSDSLIVAYIPSGCREGVRVLTVEVSVEVKNRDGLTTTITTSSAITGRGASWIHLHDRRFPSLSAAHLLQHSSLRTPTTKSRDGGATRDPSNGADSSADTDIEYGDAAAGATQGSTGDGSRGAQVSERSPQRMRGDSNDGTGSEASEEAVCGPTKRRRAYRAVVTDDANEGSGSVDCERRSEASTALASSQENQPMDTATEPLLHIAPQILSVLQAALLSAVETAVQMVISNALSEPFLEPVSDDIAPNYSSIVTTPMDLGTVQQSLSEGLYSQQLSVVQADGEPLKFALTDVAAVVADVRQVWANCLAYNGATSPYVRSAFLLQHLFEETLRRGLAKAAAAVAGGSVSCSERSDGVTVVMVATQQPLPVVVISASTVFDNCTKLRKTLSAAQIELLLEQNQGQMEEEVLVLTSEQALESERVPLHVLIEQMQQLRKQRKADGNAANVSPSDIGGLLPTRAGRGVLLSGLEYESDHTVYIRLPQPAGGMRDSGNTNCACEAAGVDQLTEMCREAQLFSDSDVLSAVANRLADEDYSCENIDDTVPVPHSAAVQAGSLGANCSHVRLLCGSSLALLRALRPQPSGGGSASTPSFLRCQVKRMAKVQLWATVASGYKCSPGNRASNMCYGLLSAERLWSLAAISRRLSVDVFPMVSSMCLTENELDNEAVQVQAALADGEGSLGLGGDVSLSGVGRRSTRGSAGRRRSPSQYVRFRYMRQALGSEAESVLTTLSVCL